MSDNIGTIDRSSDEPFGNRPENSAGDAGGNDGIIYVNPADIRRNASGTDTGDSGAGGSRRRGRPPGSTNRPKASDAASLSGIDVGDMLKGIHALLSVKLGPHWSLDDDEAKQLDKAIKRAMKHQDMKITQKQLDYAFAAYVVASVYGSRIVTSVTLAKGTKRQQGEMTSNQTGMVFPFPQPQGTA